MEKRNGEDNGWYLTNSFIPLSFRLYVSFIFDRGHVMDLLRYVVCESSQKWTQLSGSQPKFIKWHDMKSHCCLEKSWKNEKFSRIIYHRQSNHYNWWSKNTFWEQSTSFSFFFFCLAGDRCQARFSIHFS